MKYTWLLTNPPKPPTGVNSVRSTFRYFEIQSRIRRQLKPKRA
jgi:hypothetical protein